MGWNDHLDDGPDSYVDCHGTEWKLCVAPAGSKCYWCNDPVAGDALTDVEEENHMHIDCWDSYEGFENAVSGDD